MNIKDKLRGALRRIAGARAPQPRHTLPLPSILNSYGPRADALPKPTPANLRRFAETPLARKAINTIKDRVAGMRWRIQPRQGRDLAELPQGAERVRILTDNLDAPNADDSFRSLAEQVLEDVIVGGFGAIEVQLTGEPARPLALWPVDGASIRLRADWDGLPASPRYVQATGRFGPEGQVTLADDELIYIRLNPRTHTPFGLGRLEVAFETINAFLGAYRYAARLASNTVVQYALWLQDLSPANDAAAPLAFDFDPARLDEPLDVTATTATAGSSFLADLPDAEITDCSSTTLTVDAGADPPAGGGFEVRRSDYGWGLESDRNLAGRFTSRSFTLPRLARIQDYYLRQYDASSPPRYSRYSTALHLDYPL